VTLVVTSATDLAAGLANDMFMILGDLPHQSVETTKSHTRQWLRSSPTIPATMFDGVGRSDASRAGLAKTSGAAGQYGCTGLSPT
jgi:hypothetical protein